MIELKKNEEELTQEVMGKISLSKDKVNLEKHVVNLSKCVVNLSVERQIIALTNCITRSKYSYKIKIT